MSNRLAKIIPAPRLLKVDTLVGKEFIVKVVHGFREGNIPSQRAGKMVHILSGCSPLARPNLLKVDTLVGKKLIVKVVLNLVHVGGYVGILE